MTTTTTEDKYLDTEVKKNLRSSRKQLIKKKAQELLEQSDFTQLDKLTFEDVKERSLHNRDQARALIDMYYQMQKTRKQIGQREEAHMKGLDCVAEVSFLSLLRMQIEKIEKDISRIIENFVKDKPILQWAMSNYGVGHICAAGLYAHIDFETCACKAFKDIPRRDRPPHDCPGIQTAGAIWVFAGMYDSEKIPWQRGQKRPYNAALKQVCYQLGESFAKLQNNPNCFYAKFYLSKKAYYEKKNEEGGFAASARNKLERARRLRAALTPAQVACWEAGKLQPVGIDRMARRHAVTIFLSHYFHVGQELRGKKPVKPWAIEHGGHAHFIPPPNWKEGKLCLVENQ